MESIQEQDAQENISKKKEDKVEGRWGGRKLCDLETYL